MTTSQPTGGTYTIGIGDSFATYTHDHRLVCVSDPRIEWALRWANTGVA